MAAKPVGRILAALALVGVAHAQPPLGPPPKWRAPTPKVGRTAQGTRVVVVERHDLPLVSVLVAVGAGSELDPADKPGLARATARMLEEAGAGTRSGRQVAEAVEYLGAELDVEVDESGARFMLPVVSTRLDAALVFLGDVLARPRFDAAELPAVRERLVAEALRVRDEPRKAATGVFQRVLYGDHPFGHTAVGSPAALEKLSLEDVRGFWAAHYGPKTVTVILVGDTTLEQATHKVQAALAGWTSKAQPAPAPPAAQELPGRLVLVDRPGAPQSQLRVGHLGAAWSTPDVAALSVLETVLGGSFTSRLVQNLREKHGYTYGARAEFRLLRAPGPFVVQTAVRTDVTAEAIKEILAELAGMHKLSDDEVKKGRALVAQRVVEAFGDGLHAADAIADLVLHDQPLDFYGKLPDALERLDGAHLAKVAARWFREAPTIVVVGDRAAIEPRIKALLPSLTIETRDLDGNPVE